MKISKRAADLAALACCLITVGAVSAPGFATELDNGTSISSLPTLLDITKPVVLEDTAQPAVVPAVPTVVADSEEADVATIVDKAEAPAFASLAAAVAAQAMPSDASAELACLAGAIFYEAKGEPLAGQLAVAEVILNRTQSGRYPKSICGVVTQRGQFSFVRGGRIPSINPSRSDYRTAMAVAQVAIGDAWDSPAANAMYFHARYVSPGWSRARVASIGNHVFYR